MLLLHLLRGRIGPVHLLPKSKPAEGYEEFGPRFRGGAGEKFPRAAREEHERQANPRPLGPHPSRHGDVLKTAGEAPGGG